MPPNPATVPNHKAEPHSVGYTMGAIMLVVAMVALAAAYGVNAFLHSKAAAEGAGALEPTLARTLVGKSLDIPVAWFRNAEQQKAGFSSEIELELSLPLGHDGAPAPIEVTLLPLSQARPSASLLDGVYLHQFMPNELSGPRGLVGKPLYDTEGYENETVWYDALSQNPFVAKCSSAPDQRGPARCLRTVALSAGVAAIYAFNADVLDSWQAFDPQMKAMLSRIGAL